MTELLESTHLISEFSGSPRACGKGYGESQAEAIRGFLLMEVKPNRRRLNYARRCSQVLDAWEPSVVEFMRGIAQGSELSFEEVTLLLLHEEVFRGEHCTAFGATGDATKDASAIIGQNWDWSSSLYPWSRLLELKTDATPATLTYSFPGLWASAGINEHGLSLVWTSASHLPRPKLVPGIPTYAVIAGILAQSTCRAAIDLLKRTSFAGQFIFIIADAEGELWLIEAVHGRIETVSCKQVGRANHFECGDTCRLGEQKLPRATPKTNSRARGQRINELLQQHAGHITGAVAETILRDHGRPAGLSICQHTVFGRTGMTLDSFYMLPAKRQLWIARGVPCRHSYQCYSI